MNAGNAPRRLDSLLTVAALTAAIVACTVASASTADAQRRRGGLSGADRGVLLKLSGLVDAVARRQASAPAEVGLLWINHFVKAPDRLVYVPYTISIDGSFESPVAMYVRAVKRGTSGGEYDQSAMTMGAWRNLAERPGQLTADLKDLRAKAISREPHAFEDVVMFDDPPSGTVSRALWVSSGDYDVYVAMQQRSGRAKTAVFTRHLAVPDLSTEFSASTVMLADAIDPHEPARDVQEQLAMPFLIDGMRIAPLRSAVLSPHDTLKVIFWIYNEGIDVDGYPDVEVDFSFFRQLGPTGVFFNRTPPKLFTPETVPPKFDLAAAHQIMVVQSVPLARFSTGDYRLVITIIDHVTGRTIGRQTSFAVVAP